MLLSVSILLANLVLVAISSHLLTARTHVDRGREPLVWVVCLLTFSVLQIVGWGTVLGYVGVLGPWGFLLTHSLTLLALWSFLQTKEKSSNGETEVSKSRKFADILSPVERIWALGLILLVVVLGCTAVFSHVQNFDSLWYRFTRIGLWLNRGHLRLDGLQDASPHYFYPLNGQLLLTWFVCPFSNILNHGHLGAWMAGVLALAATGGIMRFFGLGWTSTLFGLTVLLGMPFWIAHMLSTQTDIILASLISSFLLLHLKSYELPRLIPLAWAAFGIGLGSKLTALFWFPGLPLIVLVSLLVQKPSLPWLRSNAMWAILSLAVFFLPRVSENLLTFGHPFSNPEHMREHASISGKALAWEKSALNFYSYSSQFFVPSTNPWPMNVAVAPVAESIAESLPDEDPFTMEGRNRKELIRMFVQAEHIDFTNVASSGAFPLLIMAVGFVASTVTTPCRRAELRRWRPFLLALAAGSFLYLLTFSTILDWYPFNFRYNLTWMPIIAVFAGFALEALARLRIAATALALCALFFLAQTTGRALFDNIFIGQYAILAHPVYSLENTVEVQGGFVEHALEPGDRLLVSGPWRYVYAGAFSRPYSGVDVAFRSIAEVMQADTVEAYMRAEGFDAAMIPSHYMEGRTGNLHLHYHSRPGQAWGQDSYAFYRLPDGDRDQPRPVVSGFRYEHHPHAGQLALVYHYQALTDSQVRLDLLNASGHGTAVELRSASSEQHVLLPARSITPMALNAPSNGAVRITVHLPKDHTEPSLVHTPFPELPIDVHVVFRNLNNLIVSPEDWIRELDHEL